MNFSCLRAVVTLLLCAAALLPPAAGASSGREWRFEVFLDDKPIGFHHFQLDSIGDTQQLRSEARFRIKLLGLTVYDYTHRSLELWQQDCLRQIDASTADNGKDFFVRGNRSGDHLVLENTAGKSSIAGCVMTFAYWNPAILEQQRLLNTQTGDYLDVSIHALGERPLQLHERTVPALHYRIDTGERDIVLLYSTERDWLGLNSTTRGGRQLRYRRVLTAAERQGGPGE